MSDPCIKNCMELPRGGYLVKTPAGYVQFGSPPETIKDTMIAVSAVPEIFVLPEKLFNWEKGISIAEVEFPLYYNYFIRGKRTVIICRENQFKNIKAVIEESVFGPEFFDISTDYNNHGVSFVPDIKSEMNFFRKGNKLSNMLRFGIFKDGHFKYKGIKISIADSGDYQVFFNDELLANVPGEIDCKITYKIGQRLKEPFTPPLFGVTCLGPSHGFDPQENTSGFIIWLNHQGIMVDPPVNSTEWLEASNVSAKFIDSIILTHCHADHDAGTFQKILEEGKITVYTTETVMNSFLRKYSLLSGVAIDYLKKLFYFHPVKIGSPVYINGARFDMFYTLHSIPTIGFKMEFQNKTFVYSSDHNNSPQLHEELFSSGVISRERYEELRNFPWHADVIYHESGVPPLHTPISYLNSLPEELQERIVIYHIAKKDFPEKTNLTLAKFGMENTLYFDTLSPKYEEPYQILSVFSRIDFLEDLPVRKAQEFLDIVEVKKFSKSQKIISKGTYGDEFHIIYSGNIMVDSEGLKSDKIYGPYDYFGEVAIVTDSMRAADVYAATDVVLFSIKRDKFLNFIANTEFEKILKKLAVIRSPETWNLFLSNPSFRSCTSGQKTWLESIFRDHGKIDCGTIIEQGSPIQSIYIIRSGEVDLQEDGKVIHTLTKGCFVGEIEKLYEDNISSFSYTVKNPTELFEIKADDMKYFLDKNPGLIMKLKYNFMRQRP